MLGVVIHKLSLYLDIGITGLAVADRAIAV